MIHVNNMNLGYKKNLIISGFFLYLATAFFSDGYHHPDEHFQILEFANFKLGASPSSDLPWEFQEQIRPSLQPTLAYYLIRAMHVIGTQNPFLEVRALRILSALLSFFVFVKLADLSTKSLPGKTGSEVLISLVFLLWFMPYLQVRYSSECWSGIVFLTAIYHLLKFERETDYHPGLLFIAGVLSGLSFFFRFQMGFAIIGAFGWLINRKVKVRDLAIFVAGGLLAGAVCIALDCWFYDELVLTPYQYFKSNIVEGKAANWGVSPWWYYLYEFLIDSVPPISLLLLGLFLHGLFLQRKHLFCWTFIPYLLAHILVGHKELRFLFPMVFPFLFFVSTGWLSLRKLFSKHLLFKIALTLSLIGNFLLLPIRSIMPAQEAIPYYRFLYIYTKKQQTTIYTKNPSIYQLAGLNLNFYKPKGLNIVTFNDFPALFSSTPMRPKPGDLLLMQAPLSFSQKDYQIEILFTIFPNWLLENNINHWQNRSRVWCIYRFK